MIAVLLKKLTTQVMAARRRLPRSFTRQSHTPSNTAVINALARSESYDYYVTIVNGIDRN